MTADSLPKLAGQALMAGFPGLEPPSLLLEAAESGELGGFILFRRNLGEISAVAELTQQLIAAFPEERPPWIGVDQEGGRVQRLGPPVVQLPPMRALGCIDDVALTEQAGALLGSQLAVLGFNIDFAPVLDVDSNPQSPVIGDRSFGLDPALVARHGVAFARGLEHAKVAACGKHFPGHGDAAVDSHFELPRVSHGIERLDRVELAPFVAARSELSAIMTAHIVFDALEPGRPATLSQRALVALLRDRVGFRGVVFSDDMEMKAIADNYGVADATCEAIAAGCDVVLICREPELCLQAHAALVHRAERESTFADRLRQAAAHSLQARKRHLPRPVAPATAAQHLLALDPGALEDRIASAPQRHAPPAT